MDNDMVDNDLYEIAYEELCKRCGCTEDERLCIESGTGDIIKCKCDNKWIGYLRGATHKVAIPLDNWAWDDASLIKNYGFSNAEKNFVKKIIVDLILKHAKTEDVLIEEPIKYARTILSRNETLESLLISHDLNDEGEKHA